MAKTRAPAVGAEGWFTESPPALIGHRCGRCGTVSFPPTNRSCPDPGCEGGEGDQERVPVGSAGTVWSYTDARYPPPAPYVPRTEPYRPFALAAVEVDGSGLVVLGQMVDGVRVDDLHIGRRVDLVIDTLFEDDDTVHTMWRWRPIPGDGAGPGPGPRDGDGDGDGEGGGR